MNALVHVVAVLAAVVLAFALFLGFCAIAACLVSSRTSRSEERQQISRSAPTNCQQEPNYPAHVTVIASLRYPDLTCHLPSGRCTTQEPHPITECGEFRAPLTLEPDALLSSLGALPMPINPFAPDDASMGELT